MKTASRKRRATDILIGFTAALGLSLCALEYVTPLKAAKYIGISLDDHDWIEEDHIPITGAFPEPPKTSPKPTPQPSVMPPTNTIENIVQDPLAELPDIQIPDGVVFFEPEILPEPDIVHTWAEVMPSFPGGEAELYNFIGNTVRYPRIARENGIGGKVVLKFVVNKKGQIRHETIEVLYTDHPLLSDEAIRVVQSMPEWIPGRQGAFKVSVPVTLPMHFHIK